MCLKDLFNFFLECVERLINGLKWTAGYWWARLSEAPLQVMSVYNYTNINAVKPGFVNMREKKV